MVLYGVEMCGLRNSTKLYGLEEVKNEIKKKGTKMKTNREKVYKISYFRYGSSLYGEKIKRKAKRSEADLPNSNTYSPLA